LRELEFGKVQMEMIRVTARDEIYIREARTEWKMGMGMGDTKVHDDNRQKSNGMNMYMTLSF